MSDPPHKKARIDTNIFIKPVYATIYGILENVRKEIMKMRAGAEPGSQGRKAKVEIEARLGMLIRDEHVKRRWQWHQGTTGTGEWVGHSMCISLQKEQRRRENLEFLPGVDEVLLNIADRAFPVGEMYSKKMREPEVVRIDRNKRRFEMKNGAFTLKETKDTFLQTDVALLAHHYDLRVAVATETPARQGDATPCPPDWVMERRKHRTTIFKKGGWWKVDITEVESVSREAPSSSSSESEVTHEVEFEMIEQFMERWLAVTGTAAVAAATETAAKQLFEALSACVPCHKDPPETKLMVPQPKRHYEEKVRMAMMNIDGDKARQERFLGSMSLPLNYAELRSVKRSRYFVTEKSDGVRMLLVVVMSPEGKPVAVAMDRSMSLQAVAGGELIGSVLGEGTVLDGEMVNDRLTWSSSFLVFDTLAVGGIKSTHLPFSKRLRQARGLVNKFLAECSALKGQGQGERVRQCVPLANKSFSETKDIQEVLKCISCEEGSRVYRGADGSCHLTDGLIFQPDTPYVTGTDNKLLKWKWPDLRSVDLAIQTNTGRGGGGGGDGGAAEFNLMCGGPDNMYIDCNRRGSTVMGLGRFDSMRLRADMDAMRTGTSGSPIVEVAYNPRIGRYSYLHLRGDKIAPNNIAVVLGVLAEQAENISVEELEYQLLVRPNQPSFQTHVEGFLQKIVKYVRKQ